MRLEKLAQLLDSAQPGARAFFCPGRVNLIGEHIDYCGGHVLPMAIPFGTYAVAAPRDDTVVRAVSRLRPGEIVFDTNDIQHRPEDEWGNYVKGVFSAAAAAGFRSRGMELLFDGDIPGGGLSSSASLAVCTALVVDALNAFGMARGELARLGRAAETEFIGLNCGVMDQIAVTFCEADHALLLDCASVEHRKVPVDTGPYRILIVDSHRDRSLVESAYNERYAETREALGRLRGRMGIGELCELAPEDLATAQRHVGDDLLNQRLEHVVLENARVLATVEALERGDTRACGELLYQSHRSLANLYGVSCRELDLLVSATASFSNAVGARMTGAGFGGAIVALVHQDHITEYAERICADYRANSDFEASVQQVAPAPGCREVVFDR